MAREAAAAKKSLVLPVAVASPVDVGRLIRELEQIDGMMLQLGLRKAGSETTLPKTSQIMNQAVEANHLNLLQKPDRETLKEFLWAVKKQSPVMHMCFSADPPPAFVEKLMTWLRREIHPGLLLNVGLQPNIGAGCIVRTTNKQFDFSLRQDFKNKRDLLIKGLAAPDVAPTPEPADAEQAAA